VNLLAAQVLWLITTMQMINKMADLYVFLHLIWNPAWKIETEDSLDDMYDSNFDVTPHLPEPDNPDSLEATLLLTAVKLGQHPYILDPEAFKSFSSKGTFTVGSAQLLLPAILSQIQLRRTIATRIDFGGGRAIRLGNSIMHCKIYNHVPLHSSASIASIAQACNLSLLKTRSILH
jgi:hypothetical protein